MAPLWKPRQSKEGYAPAGQVYLADMHSNPQTFYEERQPSFKVPTGPPKEAGTETSTLERTPTANISQLSAPMPRTPSGAMKKFIYAIKWFVVTVVVGAILAIPMIVTRATLNIDDSGTPQEVIQRYFQSQYQNLVFWLFAWILTTWIAACLFHVFALVFPYIFRMVAKYINPAHRRYWRVFRAMKWPITLLGAAICSYVAYAILIYSNDALTANVDFDQFNNMTFTDSGNSNSSTISINGNTFDDSAKQVVYTVQSVLDDVLFNVILWTCLYFIEKCMIVYVSVHHHYRSHFHSIKNSKQMLLALATLYDASVYLQPLYTHGFKAEDAIIHDSRDSVNGRLLPSSYMSRFAGAGGRKLTSAFGHLVNSEESTHWFRPGSSYAIVSRALNHPTSAAALAKRIWVSLTRDNRDAMNLADITAVLGPHRYQEAQEIFKLLDENENGDIRLSELVPTVVEVGATRHNIYAGMHDIDHALNTFDWVLCMILAVGMVFFILVSWVPQIKALRDNLALIVVGGAFIVGRIGHEFFAGAIFILFKHAFDVADHIKLYNPAESIAVACVVKRISLLYVVFERIDDGVTMQMPNDKLNTKRIENLTRSGMNREIIDLPIDFTTTFKDIELLRKELSTWISRKENSRDYRPHVEVRVKSLADMSRMELRVSFWHKSNWSNEELRAARSSRFLCALVAALRKVPIGKPGGNGAKTGEEGKPSYMVTISEDEAAAKRAAEMKLQLAKRMDFVKPEPEPTPATPKATTSALSDSEALTPSADGQRYIVKRKKLTPEEKQKRREEAAAAAAEAEQKAAEQAKLDEARRMEDEAYGAFTQVPLEIEAQTSTTVTSPGLPLQRMESRTFTFISGNETGSRRTDVGPGQNTPFYAPWS